VLDNRIFLFGGTSPCPQSAPPQITDGDEDTFGEENQLTDHDDMFVLDMGKPIS
jgi:hypothetical protein